MKKKPILSLSTVCFLFAASCYRQQPKPGDFHMNREGAIRQIEILGGGIDWRWKRISLGDRFTDDDLRLLSEFAS